MKLLNILTGLLILSFLISCQKNNNCSPKPISTNSICIDPTLIDSSGVCIEVYEPVCGCDGYTYSNSCYADKSGVTSYVSGECCD